MTSGVCMCGISNYLCFSPHLYAYMWLMAYRHKSSVYTYVYTLYIIHACLACRARDVNGYKSIPFLYFTISFDTDIEMKTVSVLKTRKSDLFVTNIQYEKQINWNDPKMLKSWRQLYLGPRWIESLLLCCCTNPVLYGEKCLIYSAQLVLKRRNKIY